MGRRNAMSKSVCSGLNSQESFAGLDPNGTPSWLGFDGVRPDRAVLLREVLSGQLIRWVLRRPVELAALIGHVATNLSSDPQC
jgi:hypothetical protein